MKKIYLILLYFFTIYTNEKPYLTEKDLMWDMEYVDDKEEQFRTKLIGLINDFKENKNRGSEYDSILDCYYQTALDFLKKRKNIFRYTGYQESNAQIVDESRLIDKIQFWKKKDLFVKYEFNNINSVIPESLFTIIESLKSNSLLLQRLILYGAPGNGKSTLMKEIASELKAEFIEVQSPTLINKYQGSGAENIKNYFYQAIDALLENNKVIIFFDEIDSICPKKNETHVDHKAALQTLWLWLDRVKSIPGIYTVFATNDFENLNKAFISRFDSNIIEIKNPGYNGRKEIIQFYFKEFNGSLGQIIQYDTELINFLAEKTQGLSVRSIEGIVRLICEKSIKNNGKINNSSIYESILIQNKLSKMEKREENKKEINNLAETHTALGAIGCMITIISASYAFYKFIERYKIKNELWDVIEDNAGYLCADGIVRWFRQEEKKLNRVNRFFKFWRYF